MAAITTAQAGPWSSTSTWTGGVIPGNGDTVTLNHAVSLTDARTVGTSPAAGSPTNAVRCNADLTIANGGVLTCRGDVGMDTGGLIMQAGGIFEFDASQAGTPATALYVIASVNFNAGNGKVTITGSAGTRCTVRSNASGGNGRIEYLESGAFVADYCDFQRIGDSGHSAIVAAPQSTQAFHIGNCTFDADCGQIGNQLGVAAGSNTTIEFLNVTHRSTSDSLGFAADVIGTGTRTIDGCVFVGNVALYRIDGYDITDTLFEAGWDWTGGPWSSFSGNLFAIPQASGGDYPTAGAAVDCYVLRVGSPTNQHGLTSTDKSEDFDGIVFDMPDGANGAGDCITMNQSASAKTINVVRCLVLPNSAGIQVGTLLSCLGGSNLTVTATHNTYCSTDGASGIYLGETYAGRSGMVSSAKSNLAWNATAATASVVFGEVGVAQDVVTSSAADYNGKWNAAGTGYRGSLTFSSGSPGAHDVADDPDFVDSTRNIKTWDASLGGAGTVANALTELGKINESGYNTNYTIANLLAYVRAGFAPQNAAFHNTGHDGTDIGAVAYQAPSTPGVLQLQNLSSTMYAALP